MYIQEEKQSIVDRPQTIVSSNVNRQTSNELHVTSPLQLATSNQQPVTNYQPLPSYSASNLTDSSSKKSVLDVLREKYGDRYSIQEVQDPIPLSLESLQGHWDHYANKLKEENKHSQVNAFNTAKLVIESDTVFNVIVDSSLQQKFIEQEKTMMLDYLQRHYHNRLIMFNFIIEEGEKEDVPLHFQLNGKQKFERIAEQYPLVKELRDRLKLDIAF